MKYYEVSFNIDCPDALRQDVADVLATLVGEAGFEAFESSADGMLGYAQQTLFDEKALKAAIQQLPFNNVRVSYILSEADYCDWNATWEQEGFSPICVDGKLVIHDGIHLPHPNAYVEPMLQVEIDTKLAFGTGNHATTRMMCSEIMSLQPTGERVLDCGTGTGVLSIVALLCNAAEAVGYDIDEWGVDNARHNAVLNHVDQRFSVVQGDSTVIDSLDKPFNVVMANISRNILLADMPRFCKAMSSGAVLLLSGFYLDDTPLLKARAQELGLDFVHERNEGEWACLQFTKK